MMKSYGKKLDNLFCRLWAQRQTTLRNLLKQSNNAAERNPSSGGRKIKISSPEQLAVITILDSFGHGIPVKEISERISLPHSNITRTLDRLYKKGLIHRTQGKTDKREKIVKLTLEGKKIALETVRINQKLEESFWSNLNESDQNNLSELLSRLL